MCIEWQAKTKLSSWHFTIYWYHFLSSVSTFMQNMNKKSLTLVVSLVTLIIFLILSNFNFLILIISKEELPQISKNVKTEQNQKANILQHSTQENFEFSSSSTNVSRKQSISSLLQNLLFDFKKFYRHWIYVWYYV